MKSGNMRTWGVLNTQHRKKNWRTPHHRKKSQRNTVTATRIFSAMIRVYTYNNILYLNNFPQNKHITTLFIVHMSILLMPVNQFSCSCEETLREVRKRTKKKERSLERWPLPQIPLFFYFAHFSWCINSRTEPLSGLKVLLSGASCVCVRYR